MKASQIGITAAASCAVLAGAGFLFYRAAWYPCHAKPQPGKTHIACVGDSITFGAGVKNPRKEAWPVYLGAALGPQVQAINYGFSGRTAGTNADWPYTREKTYRQSITDRPDIVLLMLGTNDAKPYNWDARAFAESYRILAGRYARLCGAERLYILKPPKAFVLPGHSEVMYDILDENIQAEQPILDEIAAELGAEVIDLYAFTEAHPEWFDDGVHPNAEGNRAIAAHLAERLTATQSTEKP